MALPEKRWIQRFDNYEKALAVLGRINLIREKRDLSEAERMGFIQSFEFSFELAWKLMKDFLSCKGFNEIIGSRDAIRQAFSVGIIQNGEVWMEMIESRNKTSHGYDEEVAAMIIADVSSKYIKEFEMFLVTMNKYKSEQD
jgi:nucleotidyltransferase substrate binding protein (TIGR01987 family)